jgi:hypothetical protein
MVDQKTDYKPEKNPEKLFIKDGLILLSIFYCVYCSAIYRQDHHQHQLFEQGLFLVENENLCTKLCRLYKFVLLDILYGSLEGNCYHVPSRIHVVTHR